MDHILRELEGGDWRSIGRVDRVIAKVLGDPSLFGDLFGGLFEADSIVRMRSADDIEKISAEQPLLLQPYKPLLIQEVARSEQQEVRWHVAQLLPRLHLTQTEQEAAVDTLLNCLEDDSRIVRTCSMQALADLAQADPGLRPRVVPLLRELTETGSPAMKSRGRRLLAILAAH